MSAPLTAFDLARFEDELKSRFTALNAQMNALEANVAELTAQRDELLEALRGIQAEYCNQECADPDVEDPDFHDSDCLRAKAAIARASAPNYAEQAAERGLIGSLGDNGACAGQHAHCLGCDALRVKRGEPIAPKGSCT